MDLEQAATTPVLFVGMKPLLTKAEQRELLDLEQGAGKVETDAARLEVLQAKATRRRLISEYMPIPIDGEVIPAMVADTSSQMNKNIELVGQEYRTSPQINTTSITILANSEGLFRTLSDLIYHIADMTFSGIERSPNCAFFGRGAVIPQGYLVGIGKAGDSDGTREAITITIARDVADYMPERDDKKTGVLSESTSDFGVQS